MDKFLTPAFPIASALPWIILVVAPLTMFMGNRDHYGDFQQLMATLGAVFVAASVLLLAILRLAERVPTLLRSVAGLLVGLAFGAWIQSQLLNWDLGPLDGRGIPWESFRHHARLEAAVWFVVVASTIILYIRQARIAASLAHGVWALGFASLAASGIQHVAHAPQTEGLSRGGGLSTQEALAFHDRNNLLIVVLDAYQSDAFLEIQKRYPEETEFLEGFTYYPDTVGGYPTTRHSLPLILTGTFYRNDLPYNAENRRKLESTSILSHYAAQGYGVVGDLEPPIFISFPDRMVFPPRVREHPRYGVVESGILALDTGLFRASPIAAKKIIYDEGRWFLLRLLTDSAEPPPPHRDDWRFVRHFLAEANVSSARKGEVKFIHLAAAHYPLSVQEDYRYVPDLEDTRENFLNQARGALGLVRQIVEKLHGLGIYNQTEILVLADHGAHNKRPIDLKIGDRGLDVPLAHIGGARPLLLHKKKEARGALQTSEQPMHLSYVPCLVGVAEAFDCSAFAAAASGADVPRVHYRYEWRHASWYEDYSPQMTLYEVRGDSRMGDSWRNTDTVYAEGTVRRMDRSYRIGDLVGFGRTGSSDKYTRSGWSSSDGEHRWTDGEWARLALDLSPRPSGGLILELEASGYSPDRSRPQSVKVLANDAVIATWEILDRNWFKAAIPADMMKRDELTITLHILEPHSPLERDGVPDHRELGVAAYALRLTPDADQ